MKTFITKTTTRIADGILALSSAQAAIRAHSLEDLGMGRYRILSPIEFKAGESFGHDQPIPKTIAACLEEGDGVPDLEEMDVLQLKAFANTIEAKFAPNTGKPKLIQIIKARQDQMLAEQEAEEAKAARIAELEALPQRNEAEQAELDALKA